MRKAVAEGGGGERGVKYKCQRGFMVFFFFFFQAEDGIRDKLVTGVQTCALPIYQHMDGDGTFSGICV